MTATEYPSAHLGRQKQISRAGWQVLESWLPERVRAALDRISGVVASLLTV